MASDDEWFGFEQSAVKENRQLGDGYGPAEMDKGEPEPTRGNGIDNGFRHIRGVPRGTGKGSKASI